MLLQQAMFTSSLNSTKLPLEINPTSPLGTTSSTTSSSPMMDISPLERAFAEERERALAAAAASMAASRKSPPLPPATSASADHNGNDGNKAFPFHPASLAAAFNLRPPPTTVTSVATSNSGNGVLNLSSQKSSPSDLSEVESNGGSYKETDRSSPIKEGKSRILLILALDELKPERGMSVHGKPVVLLKWTFLREYLRIPFSIQDDNGITFTTFYSHHAWKCLGIIGFYT